MIPGEITSIISVKICFIFDGFVVSSWQQHNIGSFMRFGQVIVMKLYA